MVNGMTCYNSHALAMLAYRFDVMASSDGDTVTAPDHLSVQPFAICATIWNELYRLKVLLL